MSAHEHLSGENLSEEHLSEDALIDALYGLGGADLDARIGACPVCASRWNELRERRAAMAVPLEMGVDVLAAQRRNIYRRIEHPSFGEQASRWAVPAMAAAAACVLAVGVFVHSSSSPARPVSEIPTVIPAVMSDSQLYSDVYTMEQFFEPSTAVSLGALFEPDDSALEGANRAADPGTKQ